MKMKQKVSTTLIIFAFVAGLTGAVFASILPSTTVYAQVTDNCLGLEGEALEECMRTSTPPGSAQEQPPDCQPGEPGCCGGVKTSIIGGELCGNDTGSPDVENSSIFKLLLGALKILTAGVGIAAVGGIGYGALLYTTAENKPDQVKKAIGVITNVVIGIAAYALMYVLLNFLIPGGVFS